MTAGKRTSVLGRFVDTVARHQMLMPGESVLVAVSGGADSVCLLSLLQAVAGHRQLKLHGFHMNHRLRPSAGSDERFVRELFERSGLGVAIVRSDVKGYARRHRVGLEEAGRELRYRHMTRIALRAGCAKVALGHNADDNLETMLFNLARGAGAHGLAGIPPKRGRFIRPLIDLERGEITRFLSAGNLEWLEDESNRDTAFKRNLLRHEAVPVLRRVSGSVAANARRAAALLRTEDSYLDSLAARALDDCARYLQRGVSIDTGKFGFYNPVLKRRMAKQLLPALDAEGVERMLAFMSSTTRRMAVDRTRTLVRRGKAVELVSTE